MPSRVFNIFCSQCNTFIFRYCKKGSGTLLRVYLGQIVEPSHFKKHKQAKAKSEIPPISCKQCGKKIGSPTIQKQGNRPAYRLIKGSFFKKET